MHDIDSDMMLHATSIYNTNKRKGSASSSASMHVSKSKSLSYPKSPRLGGNGHPSTTGSNISGHGKLNSSPRHASIPTLETVGGGSHPASAPFQTRSPSSSSFSSTTAPCKSSTVEVRHGKRPGQIWLPEGVVDMEAFGPILSMDETDATREFSKALVWAWCDQAEMALEEMELHLAQGNIVPLADKAHYLKGSSASLGLVKVSATCESIYHIHFPPSLAHLRAFNYTGKGNSELSSKSAKSSASSSGGSSSSSSSASGYGLNGSGSGRGSSIASPVTAYSSDTSMEGSPYHPFGGASYKMQHSTSYSPRLSSPTETTQEETASFPFGDQPMSMSSSTSTTPGSGGVEGLAASPDIYSSHSYAPRYTSPLPASQTQHGNGNGGRRGTGEYKPMDSQEEVAAHFEKMKLQRAQALLSKLKLQVKEGSEWLYTYYRESDKFAGVAS